MVNMHGGDQRSPYRLPIGKTVRCESCGQEFEITGHENVLRVREETPKSLMHRRKKRILVIACIFCDGEIEIDGVGGAYFALIS